MSLADQPLNACLLATLDLVDAGSTTLGLATEITDSDSEPLVVIGLVELNTFYRITRHMGVH